jgi:hypothetical protein
MEAPKANISFARSLMAGFFTGIITAIINLIFVYLYRSATKVNAYEFAISPLFIIVGSPILLTLSGILFFGLSWYLPRGITWYTTFFILLTLFAIIADIFSSAIRPILGGAKGLLFGIEVITGTLAAFLLPYLAGHPKIFMTREEIQESS